MNKFVVLLSIIFALNSCCNSTDQIDTTIPDCVRDIIKDSEDLKTVRIQEVDGEIHYWLNTDFVHFDGTESIVNAQCKMVCGFCGECIPLDCVEKYTGEWVIIWER